MLTSSVMRLILGVFLLIAVHFAPEPLSATPRPNVLFLAIDDLNDWVGFLGGYPGKVYTPHLDRLAASGTAFTNAHCTAPVCCPSRASVLSGLYPTSTGIYNNQHWWKPNLPKLRTIPIHFRENGYHTIGTGKIFHHTAGNNPPNQWDHFKRAPFNDNGWLRYGDSSYPWTPDKPRPREFPYSGIKLYSGEADWGVLPQAESEYDDSRVADYAINFLKNSDRRTTDKPFFLACGIFHPHLPWYTPRKYLELYPPDKIFVPENIPEDLNDIPRPGRKLAEKKSADLQRIRETGRWRTAIQHYLASISFADALVGRVLDSLRKSNAAGNTVIVLWSDHGWHLGEKGHWHKRTLWEESTRVPLIISAPEIGNMSQRCAQPVSLVDIFPTLIELCQLPPIDNLDGVSLVPWLEDPVKTRERPALTVEESGHISVRSRHHRAIHYTTGEWELYDHRSDPSERTNIAKDPKYAELIKAARDWLPKNPSQPVATKKAFIFDHSNFTWTRKKNGKIIRGK